MQIENWDNPLAHPSVDACRDFAVRAQGTKGQEQVAGVEYWSFALRASIARSWRSQMTIHTATPPPGRQ